MWSNAQYRKLVRASGFYDLAVTIGFVTPWGFALLHDWMAALHGTLGLAGQIPAFDPLQMLMANLMGSIVCVWAWLRIRDPQPQFGRYDAAARVLFASWQVYALAQGASGLIWGVLLFEVVWAVAQWMPVKQQRVAVPGAC